jgi:nucleoside triphosphate pyrophosphatase
MISNARNHGRGANGHEAAPDRWETEGGTIVARLRDHRTMLEHNASREVCANLIPGEIERDLVLASTSAGLLRLLKASGLAVCVAPEGEDERQMLETAGRMTQPDDPADVAELHVRAKIDDASARFPGALVIGAQEIVSLDGKLRESPKTLDAARDLLFELRGRTHQRHSAVALAVEGQITWSSVETAHLTMRPMSAQFIGRYLAAAGKQAIESPGAYQLDGVGLQLFERVEGAYPAVLGAPLLLLFGRLREIGFMAS